MNDNEALKNFAKTEINFSQANLERVKIVDVRPNEEQLDVKMQYESMSYDSGILLTIVYFFVFTVSLTFIKSFKSHQIVKNQLTISKRSNQIPCKLCQFFNNNYYLKCAVHPNIALKAEAIYCPDYDPRRNILD